ncbi:MAG TPA: PstS family phosphate ABC transporter substrate-binding protein [Euzebyales bacterium]|nr:PstS family phosphate ABC transporter substrate-binding protein [Euzebyales bacterium]
MRVNWRVMASLLAVLALLLTACGGGDSAAEEAPASESGGGASASSESSGDGGGDLSGTIEIDGSSTVGPLTDAIAEEYANEEPNVQVNVGISGTGGGFERFCGEGSTDISNASRPIDDAEAQLCAENGIDFTEARVGTDALTMVTSPDTEGISCLTADEVAAIFGPASIRNWSEVNPEFRDEPIEVFAPGTDSGTYDFMVEDALGLEESTQDYNASEDDNIIAQGVQGTPYSWGFFGYAYYVNNQEGLQAIEYDAGEGCVAPSEETAVDGSYGLTRPLFIYLKNSAVQEKPEVADFAQFYVDNVNSVIGSVGYIAEPDDALEEAKAAVEGAISGESAGGASEPSAAGASESAS